ncbi:MAG: hypothetical protein ACHQXA_04215 [Gemmatimonadales bacterium]
MLWKLLVVVALMILPSRLHAQQSCEGNRCSLSLGVSGTVLSTQIPPAARIAVRAVRAGLEVVTIANSAWALSISTRDAAGPPLFTGSGRAGGVVASVGDGEKGIIVTTLAPR